MDEKTQLMLNGYRESNRELTKTNQEMRINVQKFFAETLRLRAELMKKHETEILLRKLLYQSIIDNCLQLTEIVKPDADILPLLRESIKNSDTCFSSHDTQRSKTTGRRSTQLTAELRRSNSFINNRDSVRSISPLRRRGSSTDVLEESSSRDADEEQTVEKELTQDNQQTESNGILYEESDEEDWSEYVLSSESEHDNTESIPPNASDGVIQPSESVRDVTNTLVETIMSSKTQSKEIPHALASEFERGNTESFPNVSDSVNQPCESLRDVTNILANTVMDRRRKAKDIQIIKRQKQKIPTKLENSREPDNSKKQNPTRKKGKPLKNKSKASESSADEDEIQGPRTSSCGTATQTTNKSIPIAQSNNLADDVTINSIDFFEAPSSTPNKVPETSTSSSSRPVRKCRPTSLVEPSTKPKLRNTMSTKKK